MNVKLCREVITIGSCSGCVDYLKNSGLPSRVLLYERLNSRGIFDFSGLRDGKLRSFKSQHDGLVLGHLIAEMCLDDDPWSELNVIVLDLSFGRCYIEDLDCDERDFGWMILNSTPDIMVRCIHVMKAFYEAEALVWRSGKAQGEKLQDAFDRMREQLFRLDEEVLHLERSFWRVTLEELTVEHKIPDW